MFQGFCFLIIISIRSLKHGCFKPDKLYRYMSVKNQVSKHSFNYYSSDTEDYLFINPRHVWRVIRTHQRFIFLCIIALTSISQSYLFFFDDQQYLSQSQLKLEFKKSVSISPLFDQFQGFEDQNFVRLNSIINEFNSTDFMSSVLLEYIKKRMPLDYFAKGDYTKGWYHHFVRQILNNNVNEKITESVEWQTLVKSLSRHLKISGSPESNTLTISASTHNPHLSAKLVNLATKKLETYNLKSLRNKSLALKEFVATQTLEKKEQLSRLEDKYISLQKEHKISSTEEFARGRYSLYNRNLETLDDLERKIDISDKVYADIRREINKVNQSFLNSTGLKSELYLSQLQHRINLLQYQRAISTSNAESKDLSNVEVSDELQKLTEEYKVILENKNQGAEFSVLSTNEYLKSLEKSLIDINRQRNQFKLEKSALDKTLKARSIGLDGLPDILKKFEKLQRQIQIVSDLHLNLERKLQELEMVDAGIVNDIKVLDKGFVPSSPVGLSTPLRYVIAAIIGLLVALGLILAKNIFIQTVRNFRELEAEGISVIGEIPLVPQLGHPRLTPVERNIEQMLYKVQRIAPHFEKYIPHLKFIKQNLGIKSHKQENPLIVIDKPNSTEADIFRFMRLRLNSIVRDLRKDNLATVCLITSPTEKNGKTFVSSNLAAAFAKGDIKTLLIDLDLRNPSIKKIFSKNKSTIGVETVIENSNLEAAIVSVTKNLDVLMCSRPVNNPTDILESHELREFIQKQRQKYHYIFLDSPPVLAVCDPSLLAPISDLVILVAGFDISFREDILLAIEGLNAGKKLPLMGVLNLVQKPDQYYYYYGSSDEKAA